MRQRNTYVINDNMSPVYLARQFKDMTVEQAQKILDMLAGRVNRSSLPRYDTWLNRFCHRPSKLQAKFWAICAIAPDSFDDSDALVICEGGRISPQRTSGSDIVFEYLNTGDTYSATIGYDRRIGEFVVTSWGDIVETRYRRLCADRTGD